MIIFTKRAKSFLVLLFITLVTLIPTLNSNGNEYVCRSLPYVFATISFWRTRLHRYRFLIYCSDMKLPLFLPVRINDAAL